MSDPEPFIAIAFRPFGGSPFVPFFPAEPELRPLISEYIVADAQECQQWICYRKLDYAYLFGKPWVHAHPPLVVPLSVAQRAYPDFVFMQYGSCVDN
jgi:hypothetical protein